MSENDDKKSRVGGVRGPSSTKSVEATEEIGQVGKVKKAEGVGSARGAGAVGRRSNTRIMSLQEREDLFKMIHEEADKIFGKSGLPNSQRQIVEEAVKMAIDSALIDEDEKKEKEK